MSSELIHTNDYTVMARWGARAEEVDALARRWIALVERLQTIGPGFARWAHMEEDRGIVPFDPRLDVQIERMISGMETAHDGRLLPQLGTFIWLTNEPAPRSRTFSITLHAGADSGVNQVLGETDYFGSPDPSLFNFSAFKSVILAAAETFGASQAFVYSGDLQKLWETPSPVDLELAWISYVAPRFAGLVTPPAPVFTERRPDGGLLMAATTEAFSVDNPDHLAAARAIKHALTTFNAVPWSEK